MQRSAVFSDGAAQHSHRHKPTLTKNLGWHAFSFFGANSSDRSHISDSFLTQFLKCWNHRHATLIFSTNFFFTRSRRISKQNKKLK